MKSAIGNGVSSFNSEKQKKKQGQMVPVLIGRRAEPVLQSSSSFGGPLGASGHPPIAHPPSLFSSLTFSPHPHCCVGLCFAGLHHLSSSLLPSPSSSLFLSPILPLLHSLCCVGSSLVQNSMEVYELCCWLTSPGPGTSIANLVIVSHDASILP